MTVLNFLKGKKTYIVAIGGVIVSGLYYTGYINQTTYNLLMGLLGSSAAATVAAKVNRINETVNPKDEF